MLTFVILRIISKISFQFSHRFKKKLISVIDELKMILFNPLTKPVSKLPAPVGLCIVEVEVLPEDILWDYFWNTYLLMSKLILFSSKCYASPMFQI